MRNSAQRTNHCGILYLSIRKTENVGTLLQFPQKFCDTDKYDELEMDTNSLCLALFEENLEDVILAKKRAEWDRLRSKECTDNFTAIVTDNFSPELAVMSTRNKIRKNQVSSKKSLGV